MSELQKIHALGVEHGDFAERNMVKQRRHGSYRLHSPCYVLIDFPHARKNHKCKGTHCPELKNATTQLGLTTADMSN